MSRVGHHLQSMRRGVKRQLWSSHSTRTNNKARNSPKYAVLEKCTSFLDDISGSIGPFSGFHPEMAEIDNTSYCQDKNAK